MLVFVIRRSLQALLVMFVMSILVFVGVYAIGNPIDILINPQADQIEREHAIVALGLDHVLCTNERPRSPWSAPSTRGLLDSVPGQAPEHKRLRNIPGMTPSLLEIGPGCAFRARCAHAPAVCEQTPEMTQTGAHQHTRCFHPLAASRA